MGYKRYIVNSKDALRIRTSTDGYQPKFLVDNGQNFLKVQCEMGGTLRDDWRVEDIASRICSQLGIYTVFQTPCRVEILGEKGIRKERLGVVSKNFGKDGYQFISYNKLLIYRGYISKTPFEKLNSIQKLKELIISTCNLANLSYESVVNYYFSMVTVDLLVLNQDRHMKNFGVFYNLQTKRYEIARLFDFGMGLFENDTIFDSMTSFNDCMRYSYIAPYGEDPFDLADQLLTLKIYRDYLQKLQIGKLSLSRNLFIQDCAYEYYRKMKEKLSHVRRV